MASYCYLKLFCEIIIIIFFFFTRAIPRGARAPKNLKQGLFYIIAIWAKAGVTQLSQVQRSNGQNPKSTSIQPNKA